MTTTDQTRSRRFRPGDVLHFVAAAVFRAYRRGATMRALRDLDDHMLRDVGLIRSQVEPGADDPGRRR